MSENGLSYDRIVFFLRRRGYYEWDWKTQFVWMRDRRTQQIVAVPRDCAQDRESAVSRLFFELSCQMGVSAEELERSAELESRCLAR